MDIIFYGNFVEEKDAMFVFANIFCWRKTTMEIDIIGNKYFKEVLSFRMWLKNCVVV